MSEEYKEEQEKRKALQAKWRNRIIRLHKSGMPANRIYLSCVYGMKRDLRYDPKKMIEHFTGESININKKSQDDSRDEI